MCQLTPQRLHSVFPFSGAAYTHLTKHASRLDEVRGGRSIQLQQLNKVRTTLLTCVIYCSVTLNFFWLTLTHAPHWLHLLWIFTVSFWLIEWRESASVSANTMPSQMQLPLRLFGLSMWKWNTCHRKWGHSAHVQAWIGLQSTTSFSHSYCTAANGMEMGFWRMDGNYSSKAAVAQAAHCGAGWGVAIWDRLDWQEHV